MTEEKLKNTPTKSISIALQNNVAEQVKELLQEDNVYDALASLSSLPVANIVNVLEVLSNDFRTRLLAVIDEDFFKKTALWLPNYIIQEIFEIKGAEFIVNMIQEVKDDDISYFIVKDLEEEEKNQILNQLSVDNRQFIEKKLNYPKDSAGRLMRSFFISVQNTWNVSQVMFYIKELQKQQDDLSETVNDIFITNSSGIVEGSVSLYALIAADPKQKITALADSNYKTIHTYLDQEEVALIFRDTVLKSIAVVNDDDAIVGVITTEDIVDVIYKEAEEDLLLLGGAENASATRYRTIFNSAKSRLRWLSFNIIGALTIPIILGNFGDVLTTHVIIAALLPFSIALGGNSGAQSLAVTLRGLSLKIISPSNVYRQIRKELAIAIINGLALGIIGFIWGTYWGHAYIIGIIAFIAVLTNVFLGTFLGVTLPIVFKKIGIDPALGSSICITTTIDILGYLMVLVIATAFLS